MGIVLVMGFWPWMVMGNGFGWVKLGMGGGGFWLGLKSGWVGGWCVLWWLLLLE